MQERNFLYSILYYENFDALLLFKARFKRRATAAPN